MNKKMAAIATLFALTVSIAYAFETINTSALSLNQLAEQLRNDAYNSFSTHAWITDQSIAASQFSSIAEYSQHKKSVVMGTVAEDWDLQYSIAIGERASHPEYVELDNNSLLELESGGRWHITRPQNHFYSGGYNPTNPISTAGRLEDTAWVGNFYTFYPDRASAIYWALNSDINAMNINKIGNNTSTQQKAVILGHVLHLLQDMGVPEHVRDDTHAIVKSPYERILNSDHTWNDHATWPVPFDMSSITPVALGSLSQYFEDLSRYTRTHFFSSSTVFSNDQRFALDPNMAMNYCYVSSGGYYVRGIENSNSILLARYTPSAVFVHTQYVTVYGKTISNPIYRPWPTNYQEAANDSNLMSIDENCVASYWSVMRPKIISFCGGFINKFLVFYGSSAGTGTLSGIVKDAVTSQPLSGVDVRVYRLGNFLGNTNTGTNGIYSILLPANTDYDITFSKTGYITANYSNITVNVNQTNYLEAVLQIDQAHSGLGSVGGTIVDALTGYGVGGLTINLRSGINATSGAILTSTVTQSNGSYLFNNLQAGNYTAEVLGTGYNTAHFTITCIGGQTSIQDGSITPILVFGETRIILTWGATPTDLDSHLTGPLPDGTRFHMYYPLAQSNSGSPWPQYVKLDLDDVTSYGPETTTIYQQIPGLYRFSVHDYSNLGSTYSYVLSNSGAQVRVYQGSNLVRTFNVPANVEGTLWTVFEMSGSTITPINAMTYSSTPAAIMAPSRRGSVNTDADLIRNIPAKW